MQTIYLIDNKKTSGWGALDFLCNNCDIYIFVDALHNLPHYQLIQVSLKVKIVIGENAS